MHRLVLLALCAACPLALRAQSFSWLTSVAGVRGAGESFGWATAPHVGGTLAAGQAAGAVTFNASVQQWVGNQAVPLVVQYDAAGAYAWHRVVGGGAPGQARSIAADGAGGYYVAGYVEGPADFDGDGKADVGAGTDTYGFVARYTATGTLAWVKATCGRVNAVAVAPSGHVYTAGVTAYCSDFNGDGVRETPGASNVFVARYTATGTLAWVRIAKDDGHFPYPTALAVDADGNTYVTGRVHGTIDFDGNGTIDAGEAVTPVFLVSFGVDSALRWSKAFGSTRPDGGLGTAVVVHGSAVYVAGGIAGQVDFDGLPGFEAATADLTSDRTDLFVARFQTDGTYRWGRLGGGAGEDGARGVAARDDRVVVAGSIVHAADFTGDGTADVTAPGLSAVLATYTPDGAYVQARAGTATTGASEFTHVSITPEGQARVTGFATGTVSFGTTPASTIVTQTYDWITLAYTLGTLVPAEAPETPGVGLALAAAPNPFAGQTRLVLAHAGRDPVRVEVFDALGRRVAMLHDGPAPSGLALDFAAPGLPAGVYVVRATQRGRQATCLLTLLPR